MVGAIDAKPKHDDELAALGRSTLVQHQADDKPYGQTDAPSDLDLSKGRADEQTGCQPGGRADDPPQVTVGPSGFSMPHAGRVSGIRFVTYRDCRCPAEHPRFREQGTYVPYRDRARVQLWVNEYLHALPGLEGRLTVLEEAADDDGESSIVAVALRSADTVTYLQPPLVDGRPVWRAVFEGRAEPFSLDAVGLEQLTQDFADLGALCFWLQRCTDDAIRDRSQDDSN